MSPKKKASNHGKNEILSRAMFVCSETIQVPPKKLEPFRIEDGLPPTITPPSYVHSFIPPALYFKLSSKFII